MILLNAYHRLAGIRLKPLFRVFFLLSLIMACSEDDGPDDNTSHLYTPKIKELEDLTQRIVNKTWNVVRVTRSDSNITSEFSGFTIIFEGNVSYRDANVYGRYQTEHGSDIFLEEGVWQFQTGKEASQLLMDYRVVDYVLGNNDTYMRLTLLHPSEEDTDESAQAKYIFELDSDP